MAGVVCHMSRIQSGSAVSIEGAEHMGEGDNE